MSGQDIDDNAITWDGPVYIVSITDHFMLQCGEGCCGVATGDIEGYVCADIYFLYS